MKRNRFALLFAALLIGLPATAAQKTPAQLSTQVQSGYADNRIGAITPKLLRDTTQDIVDSFAPLSSLVIACSSNQWVQSITTGGVSVCAQVGFNSLSGMISPTQIPYPSLTSIGGVLAVNPVSNQFVTSINTSGVPQLAQPSFSNLSGSIVASQLIAPGPSTFGAVKSSSAAANQFATGINTSGVVTYAQPSFSNLSGTIAAAQLVAPAGGTALGGVKSSTSGANQFATGIDTTGAVTYAQPAFTNLSGSLAGSQLPAFTGGDCTTSAGSVVISCATLKAANSTWSGANTWTNSNTWSFTDAQNIGPGNFYTPWFFSHTLSAGATGYRNSVVAQIQTGVSVAGDFIVPLMGLAHLTAGSGNAFGSNSYVWVDAAAASTARASGGEFNTDIRRNITDKTGVQIVDVSTSTGTASGRDAGVWVATQTGGAGYKNGLEFSFDGGAAPVRSAGSLITGSGYTVTNGIDFSGVGFTGALIKSSNASIDGQGNVIAPTFISVGTAPTITGSGSCTLGTVTGGKTSGRFPASAICATGQTYTITLPSTFNGWNCRLNDRTTSGVVFQQTSDSATTAVLTVRSVAVANSDVIDFVCTGY